MAIAVFPGSFDPVTYGHIDLIRRTSRMFDKIVVGVLINRAKTPLFSADERVTMIREAVCDIDNVEVELFEGLSVDFARKNGATVILRGLRSATDFDSEFMMAQANHKLASDIDSVFVPANLNYNYLSSSTVREIASFGGDISNYVPSNVAEQLHKKFQ